MAGVPEVLVEISKNGWSCKDQPDKILKKKFPDYRGCGRFWEIIVNGNQTTKTVKPEQWGEIEVPPFVCAVFWNGWFAGMIDPWGGILAAGDGANENTLIESIKAA